MAVSEHERIQELLGVYAADAVDPDEAAEVESHLFECASCAREVAEHRETLSLLAPSGSQLRPPPFEDLPLDRPDAPSKATVTSIRRPARVVPAWTLAVAAALVLVLGAVSVVQLARPDQPTLVFPAALEAATDALAEPGTRTLVLRTESGYPQAEAVLTADGRGYLLPNNLRDLPDDQTYQLWALKGPERTSLILTGPDPDVMAFHTALDIDGLALTQEVAGGAPQPTKNPVAVAFLQAT